MGLTRVGRRKLYTKLTTTFAIDKWEKEELAQKRN